MRTQTASTGQHPKFDIRDAYHAYTSRKHAMPLYEIIETRETREAREELLSNASKLLELVEHLKSKPSRDLRELLQLVKQFNGAPIDELEPEAKKRLDEIFEDVYDITVHTPWAPWS